MNCCQNCKINNECECGQMILKIGEYMPKYAHEKILEIVASLDCEYFEGGDEQEAQG
ncbi:MAG: hypothetical protein PHO15_03625 [Eubacteriales bacterium]|nr:hypothetical protein [Eubacteriales bacterium]